jgi:hypothetical protein
MVQRGAAYSKNSRMGSKISKNQQINVWPNQISSATLNPGGRLGPDHSGQKIQRVRVKLPADRLQARGLLYLTDTIAVHPFPIPSGGTPLSRSGVEVA